MVDFRIDVVVNPRGAVTGSRVVERRLERITNRADAVRSSIGRMLGPLLAGTAIFQAVRTLSTFEQGIANVGAISEATAEELVALREVAQELGATTRFTATQATEGLTFLARAGFSVADSIAVVDDTLTLAQVGMLELGSAADIATNVLAGFNLGVDEASRFVDVLAKTSTSANTDVRQLGDAMKLVAPVAAGVGVSLEETAAAIGSLSNAGLQATLAGTGLRRVLSELESPSAKTEKILREMGLTVNDVRITSVGLQSALEALRERGLTAAQALEIFGQRGGPAAIVLSNTTDATKELTVELENAEGFAKRTAVAMDDNLQGSLLRAKSAFEAVILAVGGAGATGGLRSLLDGLTDALRGLAENAETLVNVAKNLAIILGPRFLLGAVNALTAAIARNPFGLIAVGAATLIALIPDLQGKFMSLVGTVIELGNAMFEQLDFTGMLVGLAVFVDRGTALLEGFLAAAGAIFDALSQQPEAAGQVMLKAVRDVAEGMVDFFAAAAQTIGNILVGIGTDAVLVLESVGGVAGALSSGSLEAANSFKENIEGALSRTANRVTTFTDQFESNFRKLAAVDLLPEVELSQGARELGAVVASEFTRGIEESNLGAAAAIEDLFAPTAELEEEAAALGEKLAAAVREPLGRETVDTNIDIVALSDTQESLRDTLDLMEQRRQLQTDLNAVIAQEPGLIDEATRAMEDFQLRALDASTNLEDGFVRAFIRIKQEAEDLAAVGEAVVETFADHATDALVEFAETGQFKFREFASAILSDLLRIIARLLVVQALNAAFGGVAASGGSLGPAVLAGARADGGSVQPGRSYLVGEKGPEILQMGNQGGNIVPNNAIGAAPEVKVQVVNVQDPNEVPQQISDGRADEAIINALARNKDRVRQVVQ